MNKGKRVFRQGEHIRWDAADLVARKDGAKGGKSAISAREAMIARLLRPRTEPVTPGEAYNHMTAEKYGGAQEARERMIKRLLKK